MAYTVPRSLRRIGDGQRRQRRRWWSAAAAAAADRFCAIVCPNIWCHVDALSYIVWRLSRSAARWRRSCAVRTFTFLLAVCRHCSRAGSWSLQALRFESDCAPLVHIFTYSSVFFGKKCKRPHTYVKRPFIPGQTFKLSTKAEGIRFQELKKTKTFRRPQIFSLDISGPKVVLVLLRKCSLMIRPCTVAAMSNGWPVSLDNRRGYALCITDTWYWQC